MGAAVRLEVQAADLHDADLPDPFRQKVYLGADQVRNLERFLTRQDVAPDRARAGTSALIRFSISATSSR